MNRGLCLTFVCVTVCLAACGDSESTTGSGGGDTTGTTGAGGSNTGGGTTATGGGTTDTGGGTTNAGGSTTTGDGGAGGGTGYDCQAAGDVETEKGTALSCKQTAQGATDEIAQCMDYMAMAPDCGAEYDAVVVCGHKAPITDWECDDEDQAAIKDGVCVPELMAYFKCAMN